jgi:peptide/nickel transport system ATP-binding protein
VRAVDGISLGVQRSRTLGLVGESGSGKTTLARAILGLTAPSAGSIELGGQLLPPDLDQRERDMLGSIQIVFQNPEEAFNPHLTIGESLCRPLITLLKQSPAEAQQTAAQLLEAVPCLPASPGVIPSSSAAGNCKGQRSPGHMPPTRIC